MMTIRFFGTVRPKPSLSLISPRDTVSSGMKLTWTALVARRPETLNLGAHLTNVPEPRCVSSPSSVSVRSSNCK
jgi:hypothetical protein